MRRHVRYNGGAPHDGLSENYTTNYKTCFKMNVISYTAKGLTALTLAVALCLPAGVAAKPKKEKPTDPRLLAIMSMSKTVKSTQFVVKGVSLATNSRAVQGFDVADDGATLWYSQPGNIGKNQPGLTKIHENYIIKGKGRSGERMTLRYFGNANSLAVEHAEDGDYVWIGSCATKWHKSYSRTRAISRIPFADKSEFNDGCAGETYYMGGSYYCWPAVDAANDILSVATSKAGAVTFNIYSLSEARALPDTEIRMKTVWKGENIGEEEETVHRTVKGKDLTTLDPVSSFTIAKPKKDEGNPQKDINYYTFRGYDIDKDYVYFVEGNPNKSDASTPSNAYVTVFDHSGKVVLPRRRISVIGDKYILNQLELSSDGYADISGIKVRDGKVYIAFSTYNKTGNRKGHRANIVKYE